MDHEQKVEAAIAAFNAVALDGERARRPILATDCDYEIVRRSGVQGMKLAPAPNPSGVRT